MLHISLCQSQNEWVKQSVSQLISQSVSKSINQSGNLTASIYDSTFIRLPRSTCESLWFKDLIGPRTQFSTIVHTIPINILRELRDTSWRSQRYIWQIWQISSGCTFCTHRTSAVEYAVMIWRWNRWNSENVSTPNKKKSIWDKFITGTLDGKTLGQ